LLLAGFLSSIIGHNSCPQICWEKASVATPPDYYEVLQVSPNAEAEIIEAAYKRLVHKWHPDRRPGDRSAPEQMKLLNDAYEVLSSPQKRQEYDSRRRQSARSQGAAEAAQRTAEQRKRAAAQRQREEERQRHEAERRRQEQVRQQREAEAAERKRDEHIGTPPAKFNLAKASAISFAVSFGICFFFVIADKKLPASLKEYVGVVLAWVFIGGSFLWLAYCWHKGSERIQCEQEGHTPRGWDHRILRLAHRTVMALYAMFFIFGCVVGIGSPIVKGCAPAPKSRAAVQRQPPVRPQSQASTPNAP
jgi:hypothetical protein